MFAIGFNHRHRIVMTRFSGRFTAEELAVFDDVARIIIEAEAPAIGLVDFTDVLGLEITRETVERRGGRPQMIAGQRRIMIAPQPEIFELGKVFAAAQAFSGSQAPALVRTMAEAEALLGFGPLQFRPIEITWLRERLAVEKNLVDQNTSSPS